MARTPAGSSGPVRLVAVGVAAGLVVGAVGGWGIAVGAGRHDGVLAASPSASASGTAAVHGGTASAGAASAAASSVPASSVPASSVPDGQIPATEDPTGHAPATVDLATSWTAPTDMPAQGRLLHVTIPATRSHFAARQALLYLPPAALTPDAPYLPVDVLLSGQSRGAGPDDVQNGGHIEQTMDVLATVDRGLTPIVVVPDQLGPQSGNPMCVDGALGNSRTYLTQDVPSWIEAHLRVQTAASAWTIGGFSQGGTCAIQLGAGDPSRFGNLIDVSGEEGPTLGTEAETIAKGFAGNRAAYLAAQPAALLAAGAPFRSTDAFFAVGARDRTYGPVMPGMAARARAAGMHVATWVVPGEAHSWITARAALAAGVAWLQARLGLAPGD